MKKKITLLFVISFIASSCSWSPRLRQQLVTGDYGQSYAALGKINHVGYAILENLPAETGLKDQAYFPFVWGAVSDHTFDYYGGSLISYSGREPAFLGVIPGVTPTDLQLQRGDRIVELDGEHVSSTMGLMKQLKKINKPTVKLGFERSGNVFYYNIPILYFRVLVHFGFSDKIKAFYSEWLSDKNYLVVSETLYNETKTDEELAYLLSHDLAHKIGQHQRKKIDNYGFLESIMARGLLASALFPSYEIGSYNAEDEKIANIQAESFMKKAGFDPSKRLDLIKRMRNDPLGRGELWFFIHPDLEEPKGAVSHADIIQHSDS